MLQHTRPISTGLTRRALDRMLKNPALESGATVTDDVEDAAAIVRAAPFGLARVSDRFEVAHASARLTHYRSNTRTATAAYALLLDNLLAGGMELTGAVEETIRSLGNHPKSIATAAELAHAAALLRSGKDVSVQLPPAPHTPAQVLAYSIVCAGAPDATTALSAAVQHAGDIAATGAITGTMFGVQRGVLALPGDLIAGLELADVVRAAADDLIIGYDPNQTWRDRYPGC